MNVTIGMIVLNEEEYIFKNLQQHYQHADRIVIVEGADKLYPGDRVTADGLSTDATAELIRNFPDPDKKIQFIQHGWCKRGGIEAKCELRNGYMERALQGLLIVIDADEFYRTDELKDILEKVRTLPRVAAWQFPQIHFWHDTTQFITGSYYDVAHCRFWQVQRGDRYVSNHNSPERHGHALRTMYTLRQDRRVVSAGLGLEKVCAPVCYHFGFCKKAENIADKNQYYINRGERRSRSRYVRSRQAWFDEGAESKYQRLVVHRYGGLLPECFVVQPTIAPALQDAPAQIGLAPAAT